MNTENNSQKSQSEAVASAAQPRVVDVFGFSVPTDTYYVHRGHAWARLEDTGQVRVGMDDFSQKLFGPADGIEFPEIGNVYYQDHVCMALVREGHKAKLLAPVDGLIETINPQVRQQPRLVHDDPYGEGWMFLVKPINLKYNLGNLYYGETNAAWIDQESHRLLSLMDTEIGVTLPDGGAIIDDVYGHFPTLGWRRLVHEFLLKDLTKTWKKRY
jgi:glycine cleavage system H lipoate-binding protein